jgi:hypothetical protein
VQPKTNRFLVFSMMKRRNQQNISKVWKQLVNDCKRLNPKPPLCWLNVFTTESETVEIHPFTLNKRVLLGCVLTQLEYPGRLVVLVINYTAFVVEYLT